MDKIQAQLRYFQWLNETQPELYRAVYNAIGNRFGLSGVEEEKAWYKTGLDVVKELVPLYVATEQQKQLNEVNLARAQAGEPPLDAADAATVSAQVGLSRQTQNTILIGVTILTAGVIGFAAIRKGK